MKINKLFLIVIFLTILGFSCGDRYTGGEEDYYDPYNPCEDCEYECEYEDCEGYVEEANSEITKLEERISELESELEELQSQYDDLEVDYNNCCY